MALLLPNTISGFPPECLGIVVCLHAFESPSSCTVSPVSVPWVILSLFFKGKAFACSTDRCTTSQSASRGTSARWRSCRCTGSTTTRSTPSTWPRSAFSSAPTACIQTSWFWPPLSTRRKGAVVSRSLNVIVCGNSFQAFSADVTLWKRHQIALRELHSYTL